MFKVQISSIFNFDRAHQSWISGVLGVKCHLEWPKCIGFVVSEWPELHFVFDFDMSGMSATVLNSIKRETTKAIHMVQQIIPKFKGG